MPSVAEQLRTAREARGLSVTEVADITKLKGDHVRALEEGNYDYFAAPVYIRGFVRTLGKLLKLDETALMNQLNAELAGTQNFNAPPKLTGQANGPVDKVLFLLSRLPWKLILPIVVLAVLVGVGIWAIRRNAEKKQDPLQDLGPGLYQGPKKSPGPTLPLPPPPTHQQQPQPPTQQPKKK
ncbi:MAG TPA: helix-turn-helix transcriptional regulator [Verrucomicrobiae bacterium]